MQKPRHSWQGFPSTDASQPDIHSLPVLRRDLPAGNPPAHHRRPPPPRIRDLHLATLGPVHNRPTGSPNIFHRCRYGQIHAEDDPALGSPLAPDRYDYQGTVLWNAHAPTLWARFMLNLRREVARLTGLPQRKPSSAVKVSYAKVTKHQ